MSSQYSCSCSRLRRAQAGQLNVYACGSWSRDSGPFQATASPGLVALAQCGLNATGLQVESPSTGSHVPNNASAGWQTVAPSGITINHIYTVNDETDNIGDGFGWWGEFYWDGGRSAAAER